MTKKKHVWFWLAPVALVVAGGAVMAAKMMQPPPADLDYALSKKTDGGLYIGTLEPGLDPVTVGPIHNWTIEVKTVDGVPVEHASISIDGGMPQHGHGLPTKPQVTQDLGDGRYLIEGMKFNMPGWWVIEIDIDGAAGTDVATFNLSL